MKNAIREQRYPIGTKFTPRGKHAKEHTVSDFFTVTNSIGEVVGCHYEATHEFLGQKIKSLVGDATISRGNPIKPELEQCN